MAFPSTGARAQRLPRPVQSDSVQPGSEAAFTPEVGQTVPGVRERLEEHVLAQLGIRSQPHRESENPPAVPFEEKAKSLLVAGCRSLGEVLVRRSARDSVPYLDAVSELQ